MAESLTRLDSSAVKTGKASPDSSEAACNHDHGPDSVPCLMPTDRTGPADTDEELPPVPRPLPAAVAKLADEMLSSLHGPRPALVPEQPTIAGYEILEKLGRGGMGVVYKARHVKLGRVVALKMILAGAAAEEKELSRFRTEAEAVARLQHPNIVQIYEVGEQDGCAYLALEFVEGGSLAQRLAGKPQPARDAAQLVETLARAVHFAHERGIVHRDLKPANVLLHEAESRGQRAESQKETEDHSDTDSLALRSPLSALCPKITDFGLAKRMEAESSQTRTGELMGTPSYMAPEQAEARARDVGPASDIYALGAILYEMLTGRPPFLGVTPLETLRQVQSEEPVPPRRLQPKLPRDLETICLKCLEKEPRRRYAEAGRLADDLRRLLAGEPIEARPIPFWERGYKWAKRRPARAGLFAVSTAAAMLLTVGGWWSYAELSTLTNDLSSQARRADHNAQLAEERRVEAETRASDAKQASEEADTQRRLAEQREQEADRQRQMADKNLRQLGLVLDKFIEYGDRLRSAESQRPSEMEEQDHTTEVTGNFPARPPHLEEVIKEMQQSTRAYYEQFVQQPSDDPEVRAEQGRAYRRLAGITAQSDEKTKAVEQYRKAIDVFEQLSRAYAEQPTYARELALSYYQVAAVYNNMAYRNRAVNTYRKALPLQEKLVHDYPDDLTYQKDLAATYHKLGSTYRDQGGKLRELAEPLLTQSLEMQQKLSKDHPDVEAYRQAVASVQASLGFLYRLTDRLDQAEALYREALETRQALLAARPTDLNQQYEVADSHFWLGGLYNLKEQWDQAEAEFRVALAIQERLFRARPNITAYAVALGSTHRHLGLVLCDRGHADSALEHFAQAIDLLSSAAQKEDARSERFLVNAHLDRSEAYTRLGRREDAQKDWRQAFTIDNARSWQQTVLRAEQLAKRGDYALAAGKADALVQEEPDQKKSVQAKRMFDLGGIYALSASAAGRDEKLPPSDRDKLAGEYAARAIELLQKAHTLGYFKDPVHVEQLKTDAKFEPLRTLDAFQKLLNELILL